MTLNAAEILGVADRLGSIEKGKDADLVIWDQHPLSTWGQRKSLSSTAKSSSNVKKVPNISGPSRAVSRRSFSYLANLA